MTFHIRKPVPRTRGNQYYKDYSIHDCGSYCGQMSDHDVTATQKAIAFENWVPCEVCLELRKNASY